MQRNLKTPSIESKKMASVEMLMETLFHNFLFHKIPVSKNQTGILIFRLPNLYQYFGCKQAFKRIMLE